MGKKKSNSISRFISVLRNIFSYIKAFFINMKILPKRRKNSRSSAKVDAWTLFWMPFVIVYFELIMRLVTKTSFFAHIFFPVAFGFAFGMILSVFTSLWKPRINRKVTIVLTIICALIYTTMSVIRNTFNTFMNPGTILKGTAGVAGNYLGEAIMSILGNFHVIVLMALPVVFYILLGKKLVRPYRYKWPMQVSFVLVSLLIFGIATFFAAVGTTRTRYNSQYNFSTATETFGLTAGLRLDAAYAGRKTSFINVDDEPESNAEDEPESAPQAEVKKEYDFNRMDLDLTKETSNEEIKELNEYVQSLTASKQNDYTGLFKGKNLILICAEAFHDAFVSPEFTPTLYRLIHNGIYCPDYYQPAWGGSTSTGEYSFVIGLAPQKSIDSIYDTIGDNMYFTMGNQLQKLGYYNIAFHNGTYDFYDRYLTHENLGYGTWCAIGQGLEEIIPGWPEDSDFFRATTETYIDLQPFSIYYMTVSGHCTYDEDDQLVDKYWDQVSPFFPDKMATTKYYICYQMELEAALTTMIEMLDEAGITDDTVIAMTTDHYPYGLEYGSFGNTQDYISDLYGHPTDTDWDRDNNAVVIWSGCLEHEHKDMAVQIDSPVFSLDILPTLLNLFGLEYDSRLLVGRDLLSNQEPLVFWLDYTWKTDKGLYDSSTGTFTPEPGADIGDQEAYINRIDQIVANKLKYSLSVVENDYYGYLFGEDTYTSSNKDLVEANPRKKTAPANTETGTDKPETDETETN